MQGKLVFGTHEVELEVIDVATAFETFAGFAFIGDEAVEASP